MNKSMKTIYEIRKAGREFCQTEGSEHYKGIGVEPAEISIANGMAEDWILTNIVKYALRFKQTQDLRDLTKISDYAHVLCGVKLDDKPELNIITCDGSHCSNSFIQNIDEADRCRDAMLINYPLDSGKCKWRVKKGVVK